MPWNLFIFPLAAGYLFLTRSYFFKFIQQRLDKQRLVFETILKGSYIGVVALIIRFGIKLIEPEWINSIYKALPFKQEYTITSMSTIIIALFFSIGFNFVLEEKKFVKKAIHKIGTELELILEKAVNNKKLVMISLKNNKVYVGWCYKLPIPSVSKYIKLLPAMSGGLAPYKSDYFHIMVQI